MIKINKFFNNPIHYLFLFLRKIQIILFYPIGRLLFKSFNYGSFISIRSSIRNFKNIQIGKNVIINPYVVLWPTFLKLGHNVQINPGTSIYGNVKIGDNVMIAPNCTIS